MEQVQSQLIAAGENLKQFCLDLKENVFASCTSDSRSEDSISEDSHLLSDESPRDDEVPSPKMAPTPEEIEDPIKLTEAALSAQSSYFASFEDVDGLSESYLSDEIREPDDLGQKVGLEAERCVVEELVARLTPENIACLHNELMESFKCFVCSHDVSASVEPPSSSASVEQMLLQNEFMETFRCFVNSHGDLHKGCTVSDCNFCTMSTLDHCFEEAECDYCISPSLSTSLQNPYCECFSSTFFS